MAGCHDMRMGQIYRCADCGMELKVIKECEDRLDDTCSCDDECSIQCCGREMVLV